MIDPASTYASTQHLTGVRATQAELGSAVPSTPEASGGGALTHDTLQISPEAKALLAAEET